MKKNNIKKFVIALSILFLSAITVTCCFAVIPKADIVPSEYDSGLTFEQASKDDKPILTVFYVDWCTYCKRFMPKLDIVRNLHKSDLSVVLINMDNPDNEKFAKKYRVSGFPTVYIIDPKYDNRVHIPPSFTDTTLNLNTEVNRYINFRKLVQKNNICK